MQIFIDIATTVMLVAIVLIFVMLALGPLIVKNDETTRLACGR